MTYRRYICLMIILLGGAILSFSQNQGQLPIVRIGIVMDGYWERNADYFGVVPVLYSVLFRVKFKGYNI